jgi:hypothetical protein
MEWGSVVRFVDNLDPLTHVIHVKHRGQYVRSRTTWLLFCQRYGRAYGADVLKVTEGPITCVVCATR